MSTPIKISQLAPITSVTNDDILIINDGDVNTRKIKFEDLTATLVKTSGSNIINGDLTITGSLNTANFTVDSDLISVDSINNRIGILVATPGFTLDIDGEVNIRNGNRLRFGDADSSAYVTLQAPAVLASDTPYALPGAYPTASGQILSCTIGGEMSWIESLTDPMGVAGDMIYRNLSNSTTRLPAGAFGQVLTISGDGIPAWENNPSGFADPMTTAGDVIVRDASNVTSRLAIGAPNQTLTVNATGTAVEWGNPPAGAGGALNTIQWNNTGALTGTTDFTYDSVTNTVTAENLTLTGELEVLSNVTLGDTTTDQISFIGQISSALLPNVNIAHDIGSPTNHWANLYLGGSLYFTEGGSAGEYHFDNLDGYKFGAYGTVGNLTPAALSLSDNLNTNIVCLGAPENSEFTGGSYKMTLPGVQGAAGQVLVNDGNGVLSWENQSGGSFDPSTIDQSLLPDTDVAYDLGSPTLRWNDLYLSGNSIDLGGTVISAVGGVLEVDGNVVGAKGDTGATGAKGEPGTVGAKGEPGTAGAKGSTGDAGAKGEAGTNGTKGEPGTAGAKGEPGADGAKGEPGAKGDTGSTPDLSGDVTLGTSSTDTLTINSRFGSHLIPTTNATYDIGEAERKIRHLFLSNNSIFFGDNDVPVRMTESGILATNNVITVNASFNGSTGAGFLWANDQIFSVGVADVQRLDTGLFQIFFTAPFATENYTVVCTAGDQDHSVIGASPRAVNVIARTAASVTILVERTDDAANDDNGYIAVMVTGPVA